MFDECEECRRLWRDYAAATAEHFQLDNKLKLAMLQYDKEKIEALMPQANSATATRQRLRDTIRDHDLQIHGRAAAAGQ